MTVIAAELGKILATIVLLALWISLEVATDRRTEQTKARRRDAIARRRTTARPQNQHLPARPRPPAPAALTALPLAPAERLAADIDRSELELADLSERIEWFRQEVDLLRTAVAA